MRCWVSTARRNCWHQTTPKPQRDKNPGGVCQAARALPAEPQSRAVADSDRAALRPSSVSPPPRSFALLITSSTVVHRLLFLLVTSWVTIVLVSLAYPIFDRNSTQILPGITSVRTGFSRDPAYAKSVFSHATEPIPATVLQWPLVNSPRQIGTRLVKKKRRR